MGNTKTLSGRTNRKPSTPAAPEFRIDGWAIRWGHLAKDRPEIFPVRIDRIEPATLRDLYPSGKVATCSYRYADRPSFAQPDRVDEFIFGVRGLICRDYVSDPTHIHATRDAALERVRQMGERRIELIKAKLSELK